MQSCSLAFLYFEQKNDLDACSTSQGNIADGVGAYEKAVALNPGLKEAWFNMGQVSVALTHCADNLSLCPWLESGLVFDMGRSVWSSACV